MEHDHRMIINGCVDGYIAPNVLVGWAIGTPASSPVLIRVWRETILIAEGVAELFRKDLNATAGFRIEIPDSLDPLDLMSGKLCVCAMASHGKETKLKVWSNLIEQLLPFAIEYRARSMSDEAWRNFLQASLINADAKARSRLERFPLDDPLLHKHKNARSESKNELSNFGLEPGLNSSNGVAVVGRDGYLFIAGGRNGLFEQYHQSLDSEPMLTVIENWIALFRKRRIKLAGCGSKYIQMIIPEKSSVLPNSYPFRVAAPTPLSRQLRKLMLADSEIAECFDDVFSHLSTHERKSDVYCRLDSHLTPFGCHEVFANLVSLLGFQLKPEIRFSESKLRGGDLAEHFRSFPLRENIAYPEREQLFAAEQCLVQTESYFPGYHNGMYATWTNTAAAIPLRVVAFANSFFGIGDASTTLSWWAARWFREFHFRWAPDIDYEYVNRIQPDLVIAQTVERFLPIVPSN